MCDAAQRAKRWYPANVQANIRATLAVGAVDMKRTNSSSAGHPAVRPTGDHVDQDRHHGDGHPEHDARRAARRQEQRRPRRVHRRWHHAGAQQRRTTVPFPRGRVRGPDGRPGARRSVTDTHEDPRQQQGGVHRSIGLGQCADREVGLLGARVDAESVPRRGDGDQREPGPCSLEGQTTPAPARLSAMGRPPAPDRRPIDPPLRPSQKETSIPTTAPNDTSQVTSAAHVSVWNPLTQPHHAPRSTPTTTSTVYRRTTAPVYPTVSRRPSLSLVVPPGGPAW